MISQTFPDRAASEIERRRAHGGRVVEADAFAPPNPSGIIPLDHRVLVFRDPVEEKSKGGIILPDSEKDKQKWATTNATVIAVGEMAWAEAIHDANRFGIEARYPQPGDRVKVGRHTGDNHTGKDDREYTIVNDDDVTALLEE